MNVCDYCGDAFDTAPVVEPDEASWLGQGCAKYCTPECREAASEARIDAFGRSNGRRQVAS